MRDDGREPYCAFGVSDGLAAGTVPAAIAPFSFFFLFFLFFLLFFFFFSSVFGVLAGLLGFVGLLVPPRCKLTGF